MVALAVVVGAAHSLSDVVAATVGAASRRRHHRLVAVQQLVTRQVSLLRLGLQLFQIHIILLVIYIYRLVWRVL